MWMCVCDSQIVTFHPVVFLGGQLVRDGKNEQVDLTYSVSGLLESQIPESHLCMSVLLRVSKEC